MNTTTNQLPETYIVLSDVRKNDIYLPYMDENKIICDFFPETFPELVQRLSDITGAFYGGMLQQAGLLFGNEAINKLSSNFLYDLGRKTVMRNRESKPNLSLDFYSLAKILAGTVFTSSPEFNFEFIELTEERLKMNVKGTDRYHKIAQKLNMTDHLEWPVLKPFIQGTCDEMHLNVIFKMEVVALNEDSSCLYSVEITIK